MEVYRESPTQVPLSIPAGAQNISVKVIRNSVTLSTSNPILSNGIYLANIPFSAVLSEGDIDVVSSFYIDSVKYDITQKVDVVTPIIPIGRIKAILGDVPEWELKKAERSVRSIIQSFTGQNFGKFSGLVTVQGQGESFIKLPRRLLTMRSITADNRPLEVIKYALAADGWYLNVRSGGILTIKEAPPNVITAPGVTSVFQNDLQYTIDGDWGYNNVPMDVQDAAGLLIEDYSCPTNKYRDSYIKSISTDGNQMIFSDGIFLGTGNARADSILQQYRMIDMVII